MSFATSHLIKINGKDNNIRQLVICMNNTISSGKAEQQPSVARVVSKHMFVKCKKEDWKMQRTKVKVNKKEKK